jgi:hypothetical protein
MLTLKVIYKIRRFIIQQLRNQQSQVELSLELTNFINFFCWLSRWNLGLFLSIYVPTTFPYYVLSNYGHLKRIGPPIFLQQNRQTDLWEYINRSQKQECRNWDCGCAVLFLGIFVSNFRYCVLAVRWDTIIPLPKIRHPLGPSLFFQTTLPQSYILSSLFEKLRDARVKTLVCKNRKPKKIAWHP